jgi:murein DD-endopeptidase MepM/ murein hydrolase activator NlpD
MTFLFALALTAAPGASAAPAGPAALIELDPGVLAQGQPVLIRVCLPGGASGPRARLLGTEFILQRAKDGCWAGAIAADLNAGPGPHELEVIDGGKSLAKRQVKVEAKDYGTRQITVAQKYVAPDPAALARHQGEMERQGAVYASLLPAALWSGPWRTPLDSEVVGVFGRRSLVNGEARSPHGGVDLRGATGTPIQAPAAGRVAYLEDTYFGGLVLLVDHGLGLISGYRHLSEAKVAVGQEVRPGQVIGLVGMSGRVTGPHLHFDLHLCGARVEPLAWIEASRRLARMLGGS